MPLMFRKQVTARRAFTERRKTLAVGMILALGLAAALTMLMVGCGGVSPTVAPTPIPSPSAAPLSASDVQNIVQTAAEASGAPTMVIAVVDRGGAVLAVYRKPSAPSTTAGNFGAAGDLHDLGLAFQRPPP